MSEHMKEYAREVKPCPCCGSPVRLVVMGKSFKPNETPFHPDVRLDILYFNVRAKVKCNECWLSIDLAQSGYYDPKLSDLRGVADSLADEVERRWNRRTDDG